MKYLHVPVALILSIAVLLASSCNEDTEFCTETTWYEDADGDGLGSPNSSIMACEQPEGFVQNSSDDDDESALTINEVDESLFLTVDGNLSITTVACTLSDGTETECLRIVSQHIASDHQMGPWCPDNITDGPEAGGLWMDNGTLYDVDGPFIENLANFYEDSGWKMFEDDGTVRKFRTQRECERGADPNIEDEFMNMCAQCLPEWVNAQETYLIPLRPVLQQESTELGDGPTLDLPGVNYGPLVRGLAFNGVRFDHPADINIILRGYQIAPVDDAGGHVNNRLGYHYHGDTGFTTRIEQADGHAAMIGYALDGHGLYAQLDENGEEPTDLDECRGHYDEIRGYHYHVMPLENNEFLDCFKGAWAL